MPLRLKEGLLGVGGILVRGIRLWEGRDVGRWFMGVCLYVDGT